MIVRTPSGVLPRYNPAPIPQPTLPRLRWPSQAADVPRRCDHCGGRVLVDVPTADQPLSDASCLLCGRPAASLIPDGARPPMTPEQFHALPVTQGRRTSKAAWGQSLDRLLALLAGDSWTARELSDEMGVSPNAVRNLVFLARQRGHQINCTTTGVYSMEVGS